ncbi:unnamed protein product [Linum tenue]|uniref:Uncharacterized protein n=1 Tax=Linum tenue TaxID=586396 RepID=A0AAV0I9R4_9ROSI|nr:unnamed protein product [Linum tenue]
MSPQISLTECKVTSFLCWFKINMVSAYISKAGTGFSWKPFRSLGRFVKLSLTSAITLCLDLWYTTVVIMMV